MCMQEFIISIAYNTFKTVHTFRFLSMVLGFGVLNIFVGQRKRIVDAFRLLKSGIDVYARVYYQHCL